MSPASFHGSHNTVCVMDASGEVGQALVERLLRRGYTVHAASQLNGDEFNKMKGLLLSAAGDDGDDRRLKVFHSDPFDYQSILEAIKGCSGLFYTFEPPRDLTTYDECTAEVEVRAAHNVLEASAQTETIDKVVYTSSVTAVVWNEGLRRSAADLDERSWSDPTFCRKLKLWHALGKTLAERTAWGLAMDRDVSMVSVNAGLVVGGHGSEMSAANPYLRGAVEMYEDGVFATVDAEFLANAHVCVYEDVSAYGRYLCFTRPIYRHEDAVELSWILDPSNPCPPPPKDDDGVRQRIQNRKLMELMEDFDGGMALLQDGRKFLN